MPYSHLTCRSTSGQWGTPLIAIDATTQAATIRRQTPYGELRAGPGSWPTDKGFVGGTTDNTGLTHLGAREYEPNTGRFISTDPLMDLFDPQQLNGYTYSNNNPTTFSDPSGQMWLADGGGGGGGNTSANDDRALIQSEHKARRQGWLNRQINLRHRAAQEAAANRIRWQVKHELGGNPAMVEIEYEIDNACKSHKSCGQSGKADIVYIDERHDTIYIWEVKSYKNGGSLRATREVQF